jgi:hypothetical protein
MAKSRKTRRKPRIQRPLTPLILLSACLLFISVNGFIGGYLMLSDPNGAPMGMPLTYLERTPFENWLLPGILLILLWGVGCILTLLGLWLRPSWLGLDRLLAFTHQHWSWDLSLALGVALIVWLLVQIITLPEMAVIQYILFVFAALMLAIPLLPKVRQYYHIQAEASPRPQRQRA